MVTLICIVMCITCWSSLAFLVYREYHRSDKKTPLADSLNGERAEKAADEAKQATDRAEQAAQIATRAQEKASDAASRAVKHEGEAADHVTTCANHAETIAIGTVMTKGYAGICMQHAEISQRATEKIDASVLAAATYASSAETNAHITIENADQTAKNARDSQSFAQQAGQDSFDAKWFAGDAEQHANAVIDFAVNTPVKECPTGQGYQCMQEFLGEGVKGLLGEGAKELHFVIHIDTPINGKAEEPVPLEEKPSANHTNATDDTAQSASVDRRMDEWCEKRSQSELALGT